MFTIYILFPSIIAHKLLYFQMVYLKCYSSIQPPVFNKILRVIFYRNNRANVDDLDKKH